MSSLVKPNDYFNQPFANAAPHIDLFRLGRVDWAYSGIGIAAVLMKYSAFDLNMSG